MRMQAGQKLCRQACHDARPLHDDGSAAASVSYDLPSRGIISGTQDLKSSRDALAVMRVGRRHLGPLGTATSTKVCGGDRSSVFARVVREHGGASFSVATRVLVHLPVSTPSPHTF